VDDKLLRYRYLYAFDAAMQGAEQKFAWLNAPQAYVSLKHEGDKVISFERGGLLFIFNFHPHQSYENYRIAVERPGCYRIALNTDEKDFGGHGRVASSSRAEYFTFEGPWCNRSHYVQVYIPCRVALVLHPI
jgi:1,4-alpha-glucan branching enzyme